MFNLSGGTAAARHIKNLILLEDGIVVRHGAADRSDVELLKEATDSAYEIVEAARDGVAVLGPQAELVNHIAQSTIQWGGMHINQALDIAAAPKASDAFARIVTRAEKIVADLTGRLVTYRDELSYVRRHNGAATHVPWHFDAGAAGTEAYDPCFNVWMPFVSVGIDCPTLEFLPRTRKRMSYNDYESSRPGYPTESWLASNTSPSDVLTIRMNPGDILIFDHWTLHRTQPLSSARVRTSAEIRITA